MKGLLDRELPYEDLAFLIGPWYGININFVAGHEASGVFQVARFQSASLEGDQACP